MPSTVVGPGEVLAERYRIERWLGQGGMGSVYRAVQLSVQRTVALKRLVDEHLESPSHVQRFEREALALSRLSHQSTVRLFDFGSDERGCPFIVMEYLEGWDLAADLERHGPMRWDQALAVAWQILGSLAEAHASGIVHRDIKPANLFLCAASAWPVVKVLDFGIAGGAEPRSGLRKLTLTGTVLGSGPYMSPEQAQGLPAGPAADLYSLGVVLFEMLTGRTPFEGRALTAQLIAKVLEVAPSLRDVCPDLDVPPEVQALVASLLEREPSRRPASAQATAERIEALLGSATLPPLARSSQRPRAPTPPIPKTEPMLVPRTIDEGWTPPRAPSPPPPQQRSRRALGGAVLLAVSAASAAWVWRALSEAPPGPDAAFAALEVLPASNAELPEPEPRLDALDAGVGGDRADAAPSPDDRAPRPEPLALVRAPALATQSLPQPRAPRAVAPRSRAPRPTPARAPLPSRVEVSAAPAAPPSAPEMAALPPSIPEAPSPLPSPTAPETASFPASSAAPEVESAPSPPRGPAPPVTPETLVLPSAAAPAARAPEPHAPEPHAPEPEAPEVEAPSTPAAPWREEPALGAPVTDPRYWTIAAARSAARRGDITPAQRNEIIKALEQRRLQARARAARAYRQGRIGYAELLRRQRAIDRRVDGW